MKLNLFVLSILVISTSFFAECGESWIKRADFGGVGRHRATGISIGTKGYMGLGHYNGAGPNIVWDDWWEYDPATNSWAQKADYNGNIPSGGTYAALSFGTAEFGFVGGGQVAGNNTFHKYDPVTNMWTPVANSPTIPMNTEGFSIGNKGYYLSGSNLFEYDVPTNMWTVKNAAPFSMGIWNSTFVIDGKAYVKSAGGLYEYKPALDQWIARAPFPGSASAGSVGISQYNKGYIVSGYSGSLANVNSEVWEYDPSTNLWQQMPEFSGTSRRFACGFNVGNRAFFGIGTNGTNFSDLWEFDVFANLEEMFDVSQFRIFPNPSSGLINFNAKNLQQFTIQLFDIAGSLISKKETFNHTITLNVKVNPGLYFYKVEVKGKIVHSGKINFI